MNRRHDGNAEIDGAAVVLNAETSILRNTALRNIQLAHDLDAGNNGRVMLFADGRHGVSEHAVNAELDQYRAVPGFDVDITGAPLQRGEDGRIDEADDRAHVARCRR